jgi:hypothetical protein
MHLLTVIIGCRHKRRQQIEVVNSVSQKDSKEASSKTADKVS